MMGGIKELTEKEHAKLIGSKHTIGWIDQETLELNDCFFGSSHRYETKPPQTFVGE